jgi:hypothetical protein
VAHAVQSPTAKVEHAGHGMWHSDDKIPIWSDDLTENRAIRGRHQPDNLACPSPVGDGYLAPQAVTPPPISTPEGPEHIRHLQDPSRYHLEPPTAYSLSASTTRLRTPSPGPTATPFSPFPPHLHPPRRYAPSSFTAGEVHSTSVGSNNRRRPVPTEPGPTTDLRLSFDRHLLLLLRSVSLPIRHPLIPVSLLPH